MSTIPEIPVGEYYYLATPYSGWESQHDAFITACHITADLMRAGVPVFSPIAHSHPVGLYGALTGDHDFWLKQVDAPLMNKAHGLLVACIHGWRESRGVTEEIETFKAAGKPVLYINGLYPTQVYDETEDAA